MYTHTYRYKSLCAHGKLISTVYIDTKDIHIFMDIYINIYIYIYMHYTYIHTHTYIYIYTHIISSFIYLYVQNMFMYIHNMNICSLYKCLCV